MSAVSAGATGTLPTRRALRPRASVTQKVDGKGGPPSRVVRYINTVFRVLVALAILAGAAWLGFNAETVREWEAVVTAAWMNPFIERGVYASNDAFMLWIAEDHLVGFKITAECTAVVLLVPLLALGSGLTLIKRVPLRRALLGVALMTIVVFVINQLRLGLIGWATQQWGFEVGFEFSHRYAGSAIGVLGFTVGLVILVLVAGVRRRRRQPRVFSAIDVETTDRGDD